MSESRDDVHGALTHERWPGWCSFCRRNYHDVGPLAEGPDQVYICRRCVEKCADIIEAASRLPDETLPTGGIKCIVPACVRRGTAHFCRAEKRKLVAEGHLCDEHGRPFLAGILLCNE